MLCPFCNGVETKVVDSRLAEEGRGVRRRRECLVCRRRFTTYERCEELPLWVIKADGRRAPFDQRELLGDLLLASKKRPLSYERFKEVALRVEYELRLQGYREVSSKLIGEKALQALLPLDRVAYLRLASYCKDFQNLESFSEEIASLEKR